MNSCRNRRGRVCRTSRSMRRPRSIAASKPRSTSRWAAVRAYGGVYLSTIKSTRITPSCQQCGPASATKPFDRAGNKIPGVSPNELTARLSYDAQDGTYKGWGAYAEYQWHDGFYMENANLLEAPGYDTVDLNVHYATEFSSGPVRSLMAYFEIRNVLDETYIASANNITDTVGFDAGNTRECLRLDLCRRSPNLLCRHESEILTSCVHNS